MGVRSYCCFVYRFIEVGSLPRRVTDYLQPQEETVVSVRMHPVAIIGPIVLALASLLVASLLSARVASNGVALKAIWILWAFPLGYSIWNFLDWQRTTFVITSNRMMLVTGVLSTSVGMLPLAKVTDMRLDQSASGRVLNYAEFVIESAGQDQALRNIPFVPYPRNIYQVILAMTFPTPQPPQPSESAEAVEPPPEEDPGFLSLAPS
ncbi:MAG TPA: PH domain-containing protein [Streptosporangiaceae bacterium]|nr:PH domain-containing protein [Streptosporangiaceae bacterium]